jgi:four helix bundle protein
MQSEKHKNSKQCKSKLIKRLEMTSSNSETKSTLKTRSYKYALDIIAFINTLNQHDLSVLVISKQLLRSATSVGANIIEAQAASSKRDFTRFFNYSLKSANESKFWLQLLRDSHKADENKAISLLQETTELANMLAASILTLKDKR